MAVRALPMARVFLEAAALDGAVAAAWRRQEEARLESQRELLLVLDERGWLRPDRHFDDLARDLWVVVAPEVWVKCIDAGMSEEQVRDWHTGLLRALLIDPAVLPTM